MNSRLFFLIFILLSCEVVESQAQMMDVVKSLSPARGSKLRFAQSLSKTEKFQQLSALLAPGDSVQFQLPDYDPDYPEVPRYFPLDTTGLYFLDFDADGDLDLLYSGQSGMMQRAGVKFFVNNSGRLALLGERDGSLLEITGDKGDYVFYTVEYPCCDSYTTRIWSFQLTKNSDAITRGTAIDIIGDGRYLKGLPQFDHSKEVVLDSPVLFGTKDDFKNMRPYFGRRTKELNDTLKANHKLALIEFDGPVKMRNLGQRTINEVNWILVMTEPMTDTPVSLYERSMSEWRRFVGWVEATKFSK